LQVGCNAVRIYGMCKHLLTNRIWESALITAALAVIGLLGCAKKPSHPEGPLACNCDLVPIGFVALRFQIPLMAKQ